MLEELKEDELSGSPLTVSGWMGFHRSHRRRPVCPGLERRGAPRRRGGGRGARGRCSSVQMSLGTVTLVSPSILVLNGIYYSPGIDEPRHRYVGFPLYFGFERKFSGFETRGSKCCQKKLRDWMSTFSKLEGQKHIF